jgi:hypothetical protein
MNTPTHFTPLAILTLAACLAAPAQAGDSEAAEREAHMIIADIQRDVLAEQFRHVEMEAFKARLELRMHALEVRRMPEREREGAHRKLELHEQRLHLLEQMSAELRERIVMTHVRAAEIGAHPEHQEHHAHRAPIDGVWSGHDRENETEIRLVVEHGHARLEVPSEEVWFEGEFSIHPVDDGLSHVEFRISDTAEAEYRGKTSLGLARLTDDRLVLAANEPGKKSRPTSLEDSEGTRLFVFERE